MARGSDEDVGSWEQRFDLAEKTGFSDSTIRTRAGDCSLKDAHYEVIARVLGVSANYLRKRDGCRESEVVYFLMEVEGMDFLGLP